VDGLGARAAAELEASMAAEVDAATLHILASLGDDPAKLVNIYIQHPKHHTLEIKLMCGVERHRRGSRVDQGAKVAAHRSRLAGDGAHLFLACHRALCKH